MENCEKPIQFADLNEYQGSSDRATNEFPDIENKAASFEPQIIFPNQQLTADPYFGYMKVETTKLLMFSTVIRYFVLLKVFLSMMYLACIEWYLVIFFPIVILEFIGYCSSKALNLCWSIVYLVFLILSFGARIFGIYIIINLYKLYYQLYEDCWNDYYRNQNEYEYYSDDCLYYFRWKMLFMHLLIAFVLVLVYEFLQIILQFKFIRAIKNLTEESKKVVLEMINSKDTSLCFCCKFNK